MDFHKPNHGGEVHQIGWRFHAYFMRAGLILIACFIAFSLSAAAPPADAEYRLARQLYSGTGGTQDVARAVILFEQSAAAGHPLAQLKLGVLHEFGIGRKRDLAEAARWYYLAAKQGHAGAQARLGLLLCQSPPFTSLTTTVLLGTNRVQLPDHEVAAQWLQTAAGQNYPPAQLWLGDLITTPYLKAGSPGLWLRNTYGTPATWYSKAAEAGVPGASFKAGDAYLAGEKFGEAYRWFLQAQREGIAGAWKSLELVEPFLAPADLLAGQGSKTDKVTFSENPLWIEWSELLSLHGAGPVPFFSTTSSNNFAALRIAAEQGDAVAQFNLALTLQHESPSFSRSMAGSLADYSVNRIVRPDATARISEAVIWYQRAAASGHHDAEFHLAMVWVYGLEGVHDYHEAQRLLMSAAKAGHREAQYELALLLDEGFAGDARPDEATTWFQKAADAGHLGARKRLVERAGVSGLSLPRDAGKTNRTARLAIISPQSEFQREADMLLLELGKQKQFEIVERTEIDRLFRELSLSVTHSQDYLKLGQLLKADGLLLLEADGGKLTARLVAVDPGIILTQMEMPLPITDVLAWTAGIVRQVIPLEKKLLVAVRDAVPVSLLSLRSATSSAEEVGLDRSLTVLLKRRLSLYPEVFVLERSRLGQLSQEKEMTAATEQKFWGGSYILEGNLNRSGIKAGMLSIDLRLTSPGHRVRVFSETGPADRPQELLNRLVEQVVAEVTHGTRHLEWKPEEEAKLYQADAEWAFRQKLFLSAEEASEAAWALGLRTPDLALLRIQSYAQDSRWQLYSSSREANGGQMEKLLLAMELYAQQTNNPAFQPGNTNLFGSWVTLGGGLFVLAADTLVRFATIPSESRMYWDGQLSRMRLLCRDLITVTSVHLDIMDEKAKADFLKQITYNSALFYENHEDAGRHLRELILSGSYRRAVDLKRAHYEERRLNLTVWDLNPKGAEILYKTYRRVFDELEKDQRPQVREDIFMGQLLLAVSIYDFRFSFNALAQLAWENKEPYSQTDKLYLLLNQMNDELTFRERKYSSREEAILKQLREDYSGLMARLQPWLAKRDERLAAAKQQQELAKQQAALAQKQQWEKKIQEQRAKMKDMRSSFDEKRFEQLKDVLKEANRASPDLFALVPMSMTEAQAKELQPLMAAYRERVGGDFSYKFLEGRVATVLKLNPPRPNKAGEPPYMRGDMTVPDWKSAHLPATPSRLQNQPPPQSLPFASRLSQSGFLGALGKSRSVPADEDHMKPLLMVDHWRLPGKLVGESNDFNNTIMAVDSVGDELLLDVRRSGFRGGSRDFLLVNPVDFSTRKIQLPESSGKQMLVATYDFERAGEQRPLARLGDHLFRSSRDGVLRYSLSSGNWELLPLLIPQDACLIAAPPHLLAYNRQGIYLVDMAAGAVKILCSNRRRPIETPLDELPDLFRVEIAALGTEHLLCLVNDKSFQFDTKSFKWAPWPEPLGFGRQFKSFQGGVLVGMGTAPLVFGYDLLSEPGAKSQPLFQFARIGDPGLAAGPLDVMAQKIAQPRWLAKIPQQVHSFGFSPLDVTRRNDQLVFLQWQPDTSPVKGTAATYLATLIVCERGLAEPISLKLQWNPSAGGAPEPYLARSVSVHSTTSHLVAVANNFAGVWAISWKRIDDEIAQTREKLRQKLAQDIAAHPDDRRLLRIRDEKNPY